MLKQIANHILDQIDTEKSDKAKNYVVLELTKEEAQVLADLDGVLSVEEDVIVTAMTNEEDIAVTDAASNQAYEWNLSAIHATPTDLAEYDTDESLVRVAVLDSGTGVCLDLDVIEYVNLVPSEQHVVTYDEDGTGHGTAVAGILEANDDNSGILGVAPDVSMYSVKVFDYSNTAPISRIVEGIYWAIDHDMHIINMSFGTDVNSYALHQAIRAAYDAGILMIAAAGNQGVVEYPAAYPEVMAVGATDYTGTRTDFSAMGDALEIMAPGKCVLTDSFYGGLMALDGTSLSAPHVAGAAALLWAKDMSKSSDFIRRLLDTSANRSLGSAEEYGNGLLDVRRAFEIYEEFEENYVPGMIEYDAIEENNEKYIVGENPGYVVGSWNNNEHRDSIVQCRNLYDSDDITYMKKVSYYLDLVPAEEEIENVEYYLENSTFFNSNAYNAYFHGGRNYGSKSMRKTSNYVNDLIFMYKLAIELKGMARGATLSEQCDKVDCVKNHMGNSAEIHSDFITRVKKLLATTITVSDMGNQTSPEVNAYKILGAALHMAGDTYAHRSIIPRNAINNTIYDNTNPAINGNYFNTYHFNNNASVCPSSYIEERAYNALSDNLSTLICDDCNWGCFRYGVEHGMMEFKDIRRWLSREMGNKYEDNPNFYRSRYTIGTMYTTNIILTRFADNADLDGTLFLPGVNGYPSYSIRLNSLRKLYIEAGLEWEPEPGDDWSTYTTTIVR